MEPSAPAKILIVDDEEPILTMLQQILQLEGYEVLITPSGIEALYLLAQDQYQLLITDINMPQMDGLTLTQRALDHDPDLAIILATGVANRDTAYQAYELGATGYLLKPFDPNEIRIYVANILRLRKLEIAHKSQINQLEEQVSVSEQRLKSVVGQLPIVLWALDHKGIFTLSEGKGLNALALQPGEAIGQSAFALYGQLPEVKRSIQRALKGEAFTGQFWVAERLYENHYSPLRGSTGELIGTICISIDITDAHHLQEEVIKKTRLASLGELAAGVAHEINNPNAMVLLNGSELVHIYTDIAPILEKHYQDHGSFKLGNLDYLDVKDELPQILGHIVDSSQRIKTIVQDLRSFVSREEKPVDDLVDLNKIVRSALPYIEQTINDSTENFSVTYSPEPLPVRCISQRLEQIIVNLLQNACQSLTDKKAGVALSLAHDPETQRQIIKIVDEGCGISTENLARIKEPFFTTRRDKGGTGLGLSVSIRMVEECSGSLDFISNPGIGTTAILAFPAIEDLSV